jgi:hypothetical protein
MRSFFIRRLLFRQYWESRFSVIHVSTKLTFGLLAGLTAAKAESLKPFVIMENGGWCWFQDERAIISSGKIVAGAVAGDDRAGFSSGDVIATFFDPATGQRKNIVLHARLHRDDHAAPSFIEDKAGRVIAAYSTHGRDKLTRWRLLDGTTALPEAVFENREPTTYTNLLRTCAAHGCRLWNFIRSEGWDPNFLVSENDGAQWRYGGRLFDLPGRPYLKYASDGSVIHLAASEQHPRDFGTSVYYATISDTSAPPLSDTSKLEQVFAGDDLHRAWPIDIELGSDGEPRILFSVQVKESRLLEYFWPGQDNRYYLGRRGKDGIWSVSQIAYAGRALYAAESEYTGLGAIDPNLADRVVISANVDPKTGVGLKHYELFKGMPGPEAWSWKSLTTDSTADNLRPTILRGKLNGSSVLLWQRGALRSYSDYSTEILGALLP